MSASTPLTFKAVDATTNQNISFELPVNNPRSWSLDYLTSEVFTGTVLLTIQGSNDPACLGDPTLFKDYKTKSNAIPATDDLAFFDDFFPFKYMQIKYEFGTTVSGTFDLRFDFSL